MLLDIQWVSTKPDSTVEINSLEDLFTLVKKEQAPVIITEKTEMVGDTPHERVWVGTGEFYLTVYNGYME